MVFVLLVRKIKACDIKTLPYPGFPTDMQSQMMTLMLKAEGTNIVLRQYLKIVLCT